MEEVKADELQTFLTKGIRGRNPYRMPVVERFFEHNLKNEADADWLGEAVEFTPSLAVLTNANGDRAIDCAALKCKQAMQDALVHRAMVNAEAEAKKATPPTSDSLLPPNRKEVKADDLQTFLVNHTYKAKVVECFFATNLTNIADADWLGEAVEFTPSLAGLRNADGDRAIDCAVPACMHKMQAGLHRAMNTEAAAKVRRLCYLQHLPDLTLAHTNPNSHQVKGALESMPGVASAKVRLQKRAQP